jgi:hypothetical protein
VSHAESLKNGRLLLSERWSRKEGVDGFGVPAACKEDAQKNTNNECKQLSYLYHLLVILLYNQRAIESNGHRVSGIS